MTSLSRREFLAATAAATTAGFASARAPISEPKFKLGLVTYNVAKDWDLPTTLRICKSAGLAAVECRTTHKHGVEPSLSGDARKDVKKQFADAGIVFWGCGSVCEFHSEKPEVVKKNVETCKEFVKLVSDIGGIGVKVRPNGIGKGMTVEQTCEQIGKALTECGKAAGDAGLVISVEVHGPTTQLPKNMKAIMDACGHPAVGVTWNSNGTDLANGSLAEGFDLLAKHIRSCHINDLENDKSGKYPYRDLFRRLAGIGYDRYTMCEVGKAYDPVAGEAFLKKYKAMWDELVKG
jgi:sugar phosphate isomerase/epimerase